MTFTECISNFFDVCFDFCSNKENKKPKDTKQRWLRFYWRRVKNKAEPTANHFLFSFTSDVIVIVGIIIATLSMINSDKRIALIVEYWTSLHLISSISKRDTNVFRCFIGHNKLYDFFNVKNRFSNLIPKLLERRNSLSHFHDLSRTKIATAQKTSRWSVWCGVCDALQNMFRQFGLNSGSVFDKKKTIQRIIFLTDFSLLFSVNEINGCQCLHDLSEDDQTKVTSF